MDNSKLLENRPIGSLLTKFSMPAVIGMLVNALYNMVDKIFIGRGVDPSAIGGVNIAMPFSMVVIGFAMLIGVGGNALFAIRLGEKNNKDAEIILANSFVLLIAVSALIGVAGWIFCGPIIKFFGATTENFSYASDYMSIICLGTVFQCVGLGMNNFVRSMGHPWISMCTMLIGAVLNTILDPVFIFAMNMGVKGAALATIIAQLASLIWVMMYILNKQRPIKLRLKNFLPHFQIIAKFVAIGLAPFSVQIAAGLLNTVLNKTLKAYGGDVAVSGMGIVLSAGMIFVMPVFGITQGAQPIIGYNHGAEKFDRVKKTLKLAIWAATAFVSLGFIVIMIFSPVFAKMFVKQSDNKELLDFTIRALRIYFLCSPLIGFQIVSSHYFQSVGKPKQSMILSLSRQVVFLIPFILIFPRVFGGLNGILYAVPAADLISSVITAVFLYRELKNLRQKKSESTK